MRLYYSDQQRERGYFVAACLSLYDHQCFFESTKTLTEVLRIYGNCLGMNPYTIKLRRDSYDRIVPNRRKGWKDAIITTQMKSILEEARRLGREAAIARCRAWLVTDGKEDEKRNDPGKARGAFPGRVSHDRCAGRRCAGAGRLPPRRAGRGPRSGGRGRSFRWSRPAGRGGCG